MFLAHLVGCHTHVLKYVRAVDEEDVVGVPAAMGETLTQISTNQQLLFPVCW